MKRQTTALLVLLSSIAIVTKAQTSTATDKSAQDTQIRGYWIDPATGFMWAGKDNGKDISWKGANKYCRDLRLASHSDWRLPNMLELQPIFDKTANAPGLAGPHDDDPTMWHVKGNIFLTGEQWSRDDILDDHGHPSAYHYYFDFNEGKPNDDPTGWPYPFVFRRALCVRGPGK